jgi:glycosyltransferase involved in cell wall biosynthesis
VTFEGRLPHVGYLVQDFPPEVGAGPARVTEMAHRWQSHGARVTVITGMPNRRIPDRGEGTIDSRYRGKLFMQEDWQGIRTLRSWVYATRGRGFRRKIVNNASFMLTGFLHGLARSGEVDVLIASSPPFLSHVSGALLARLRRIPLVLEIRDLWPDYMVAMGMLENLRAQRALFALERWLLRQARHVVVVTDAFRERVVGKGVPRERVSVIPNGVEVDHYYASSEPPPFPALGRSDNECVVGYLGTFGRGQALGTVVQAAVLVRRVDQTVRFVLVGDGPDLPSIQHEIRKSGVDTVSIHPPIRRDQTRAFYNACDVCLVPLAPIPIFQETVPSKMFEVMACERPLIAALAGEGAKIVDESGGGLCVDPGDARALADAILQMRRMPDERRREMGRRARAYVTTHYSRAALADCYLDLLRSLNAPSTERRR